MMLKNKVSRRMLLIFSALTLIIPSWSTAWPSLMEAAEAAPGYQFERLTPDKQYDFNSIMDVAVDGQGSVYAADYSNHRIIKLDADGEILSTWQGEANFYPNALAVDAAGAVYAANGGSRIEKIDVTSASPPSFAAGAGQFGYIEALAVDDGNGIVYAADSDENKLWLLDEQGQLTSWDTYTDSLGQAVSFHSPSGVAVDEEGSVYILENGNRLLILNTEGVLLGQITFEGYYSLSAIKVDSLGNIYAADNREDVVLRWNESGVISTFAGSGQKNLQFDSPSGLAVDNNGNIYVADTYNYRVQKLNANLEHLATWGRHGGEAGQFYYPEGIAAAPGGKIYVADTGNYRMQLFDTDFTFLEERGNPDNPQSFSPFGLASDRTGDIYITSYGQLYKYHAASGETQLLRSGFFEPRGVAVDDEGNIYVADTVGHQVVKLDSQGVIVTSWDGELEESNIYFRPQGIAVDSAREVVYVSDSSNIQLFSLEGEQLETSWGEPENGRFQYIRGMALDAAGNVYVADGSANRISKFAPDGSRMVSWGQPGTGEGETDELGAIAVDDLGNVYIVDVYNHRIQKFAYDLNHLSGIDLSQGILNQPFHSQQTSYSVLVESNVEELTLTPKARHDGAVIRVNGVEVASGEASEVIALEMEDSTSVVIEVTAADRQMRSYTLEISRKQSDITPPPPPASNSGAITSGQEQARQVNGIQVVRKRTADGKRVDVVSLDEQSILVFAKAASTTAQKIARIVIDELPKEPADIVTVNLSRKAIGTLDEYKIDLEIQIDDALISMSRETIALLKTDARDLVFNIVPHKHAADLKETVNRVLQSEEVSKASAGKSAEVVGIPVEITTNYTGRETKLVFPLTSAALPADPLELERMLHSLAVYVEHSDGEKALKRGEIVYDAGGKPTGYEITVSKFSIFTLVNLHDAVLYERYIYGDKNGRFNPEQTITRAELAALLSRNYEADGSAATSGSFPDVASTHWAAASIALMKHAALMNGDSAGQFRPGAAVTRAEMAAIIANWEKLELGADDSHFTDTKGHWAAKAIAAVQENKLMTGYQDGSFRPNRPLTRAETVKVLNRLLQRPVLREANATPTWEDVPVTHWAYADIESASRSFANRAVE